MPNNLYHTLRLKNLSPTSFYSFSAFVYIDKQAAVQLFGRKFTTIKQKNCFCLGFYSQDFSWTLKTDVFPQWPSDNFTQNSSNKFILFNLDENYVSDALIFVTNYFIFLIFNQNFKRLRVDCDSSIKSIMWKHSTGVDHINKKCKLLLLVNHLNITFPLFCHMFKLNRIVASSSLNSSPSYYPATSDMTNIKQFLSVCLSYLIVCLNKGQLNTLRSGINFYSTIAPIQLSSFLSLLHH